MMLARRELFAGGGLAIAAAAVIRGRALRAHDDAVSLPSGSIPTDRDALVLHHGGGAADALVRSVRAAAPRRRIADAAVAVLAPGGFDQAGALLDRARGRTVIALLDEADTIVIETQLLSRGARALTRRRQGARTLLTARI